VSEVYLQLIGNCYNRSIKAEAEIFKLDAMKFIPKLNKALQVTPRDMTVVEKIPWSLRQRLRAQLKQLNVEFFDEADDFLFSVGKQVQFDEENAYLSSMRELRTKQSLFDGTFISDILSRLRQSYPQASGRDNNLTGKGLGAAFERVEIDLAFRSMRRKVEKLYSPHLKQIDSLNLRLHHLFNEEVVSGSVLIQASSEAFMHSQSCFTLPLDIRLVFIKLLSNTACYKGKSRSWTLLGYSLMPVIISLLIS
jgi:hypothetical protein